MQTVWDVVRHAAARTPNRVAVTQEDRELTYRGLVDEVSIVAAGMANIGLRSGDRVATVLPNTIEHLCTLLAVQRLGAVAAPMNPRLKPNQVIETMRSSSVDWLVAPPDDSLIDAAAAVVSRRAQIVVVGGEAPDGCTAFRDCRGGLEVLPPVPRPPAEATAFLFYTAGTTGAPKAVAIPHRATQMRCLFMSTQGGLRHGENNHLLAIMPLFHVVGFYAVALTSCALNGTCHLVPVFDPELVLQATQRRRVTCLFGAPTMLHAILEADEADASRLAAVQTVLYAGSSMPLALLERLYERAPCAEYVNIYGTTETMNTLYMRNPIKQPNWLLPGHGSVVRVARFGSRNEDAATGEEGELIVDMSCDAVFTGYDNNDQASADKIVDGWYHTGDVAVWDDQGRIELHGRLDDMIISGGENIHPSEVEDAIARHSAVREVGVIGLPDDRWGEAVTAFVVCRFPTSEGELDEHVRASQLADYKRPRRYVIMDRELPRNAANKLLRTKLRTMTME